MYCYLLSDQTILCRKIRQIQQFSRTLLESYTLSLHLAFSCAKVTVHAGVLLSDAIVLSSVARLLSCWVSMCYTCWFHAHYVLWLPQCLRIIFGTIKETLSIKWTNCNIYKKNNDFTDSSMIYYIHLQIGSKKERVLYKWCEGQSDCKQNRSTEGCSKLKRSLDMRSSGMNGLNIRTNASPKWDRTRCPKE